MDWLWEDNCTCTQRPELEHIMKQKEREDIAVKVRERELRTPECHKKFYGWEDKEFWEDSLRNTEMLRKSQKISIIISTLNPRVINTRTRVFWSKPFTKWNKKKSERSNLKSNKKPEEQRINKEKKRELTRSLRFLV